MKTKKLTIYTTRFMTDDEIKLYKVLTPLKIDWKVLEDLGVYTVKNREDIDDSGELVETVVKLENI